MKVSKILVIVKWIIAILDVLSDVLSKSSSNKSSKSVDDE